MEFTKLPISCVQVGLREKVHTPVNTATSTPAHNITLSWHSSQKRLDRTESVLEVYCLSVELLSEKRANRIITSDVTTFPSFRTRLVAEALNIISKFASKSIISQHILNGKHGNLAQMHLQGSNNVTMKRKRYAKMVRVGLQQRGSCFSMISMASL